MASGLTFQEEPWSSFWPEADALTKEHFHEVQGGVDPTRPYDLDAEMMNNAAKLGVVRIYTARKDGHLVSYIIWQVSSDAESRKITIAQMGPWFSRPDIRNVGGRLFMFSLRRLFEAGIRHFFPHHRLKGRGRAIGKFFKSLGAEEIQHTFYLVLNEAP